MEKKYDYQFKVVFDAIKQLLEPPEKPKKRIGFLADGKGGNKFVIRDSGAT